MRVCLSEAQEKKLRETLETIEYFNSDQCGLLTPERTRVAISLAVEVCQLIVDNAERIDVKRIVECAENAQQIASDLMRGNL